MAADIREYRTDTRRLHDYLGKRHFRDEKAVVRFPELSQRSNAKGSSVQ
jgi:hypothetical protein